MATAIAGGVTQAANARLVPEAGSTTDITTKLPPAASRNVDVHDAMRWYQATVSR